MTTRLPPKIIALVAAGAGAATIATTLIPAEEGRALVAYQDGARVWTICDGHTKGVTPGQTATDAECDAMRASDVGRALAETGRIVHVPMSEARRAAVASFCGYNLGLAKCAQSTFIRRLNAGDPGACDEILRWVFVGGKDCRDPASNCRGIVARREREAELCRM